VSVVVVGSIGLDTIETPMGKVEEALGGSAVYASLAASYFSRAQLVGVVGEDYPAEAIELLKAHKIDLEGLCIQPGKTFRWSGRYDNWNQAHTLNTELNVFAEFEPRLPAGCRSCRSLLLANIHPRLQLQVLQQTEDYRWVACDTMNYWINLCPDEVTEVIRKVDIVFINEDEIRLYTGKDNIFKAAEAILSLGAKLVVIKRGEYGSVTVTANDKFFCPAYPVEQVIDPTGAGDCFAGGFMSYLAWRGQLDGDSIRSAVRHGTVLAGLNVGSFSVDGITGLRLDDIEARVRELVQWT
jgi:sugar/nucleoside kinase (ribokinase family)